MADTDALKCAKYFIEKAEAKMDFIEKEDTISSNAGLAIAYALITICERFDRVINKEDALMSLP